MRQLAEKYQKDALNAVSVSQWLEAKKKEADAKVDDTKSPSDAHWGGWIIAAILSLVAAAITAIVTGEGHGHEWVDGVRNCIRTPGRPYPTIGYVFLLSAPGLVVISMLSAIWANKETAQLRQQKRAEVDAELKADPFFVRATLILDAIKSWIGRRDQYMAWCEAVNDELMPPDEKTGNRNYTFLEGSHRAIEKAIKNFENGLKLKARQDKFREEHPELTSMGSSTALADLIAQLDAPVELPNKDPFLEPGIVLDTEAELAAISETELDERFKKLEAAEAMGNKPPSSATT